MGSTRETMAGYVRELDGNDQEGFHQSWTPGARWSLEGTWRAEGGDPAATATGTPLECVPSVRSVM